MSPPFGILIAEDNPADVALVREALKAHDVDYVLHVLRDGEQALALLDSLDRDPNLPRVDLLILDMHLPKHDGEDVLKRLRSTEHYAQTPVIVMTSQKSSGIEAKAAKHAAMYYFQKPSTMWMSSHGGWSVARGTKRASLSAARGASSAATRQWNGGRGTMTALGLQAIMHIGRGSDRVDHEALDALPVAVYITDAEGRLTYFNPAATKLSDRIPQLGVDHWCVTWKIFLPDGTPLPHDQCPMAVALKGGEITEGIECLAERPDGSRFWFTPYPAVLRDAEGRITGGINLLVDITDRKLAQRTAERQGRLLSAIVDSSDDAIVSKDLNGTITSWNKSAERLFGYTAEEIVGKPVTLLIPPDRQDEEPRIIERLKAGERVDHFETIRRRKDGTLLNISLTISPVRDETGQIAGASKIARDITERQRAEAEIRRANQDLEQFAFSASHDLQEPLRSVKIYSELLTRRYSDKLDGQALEFLEFVRSGATRMELLVSDLLAYTQVSKREESPEFADANVALGIVLESMASSISESGARITSDPLPEVPMHGAHLQQLFQNLIGNAIKYRTPERTPEIHIAVERRRDGWTFTVTDNGIGIAPEYKETVFGLFKRLHTNDEYSGTGIGLAICQRIVDEYNGRIWVESEPGRGSAFRFTIPPSRAGGG